MRTGRALTISGGVHPSRIFLGGEMKLGKKRNWKKKKKKFSDPPKIWSRHPPKKNLEQAPPQIWSRHPPRKFGAGTPPPLLTESQTRVKILPWPNFVAAGKKMAAKGTRIDFMFLASPPCPAAGSATVVTQL